MVDKHTLILLSYVVAGWLVGCMSFMDLFLPPSSSMIPPSLFHIDPNAFYDANDNIGPKWDSVKTLLLLLA